MIIKFINFGIYVVDVDYLKALYDKDHNVYYSPNNNYEEKPFLGLLIILDKTLYLIPFTSSKKRNIKMPDTGSDYFLISEIIPRQKIGNHTIYKDNQKDKRFVQHIVAELDLKKMIPVKKGLYQQVDFMKVKNSFYRNILSIEYNFCKNIHQDIVKKAENIYTRQKTSGNVRPYHCNFALPESVCKNYNIPKKDNKQK